MPAWSDQTPTAPCLPLIPAVPQVTAWGIFWKGICCFLTHPFFARPGLACSICVQHLPSSYPCSPTPLLHAGNTEVFILVLEMHSSLWKAENDQLLKNTRCGFDLVYSTGFFSPPPESLQRFFSLLWKLSDPHARLTAVCVMASHSSWHALCSLAIGNALNTEFSLTFI